MHASTIFRILIASALIYSCSDRDGGPGGGGGGDAGRRDSGGGGPDSGGGGDDGGGGGDDAGGGGDDAGRGDAPGGPRDAGRDSGGSSGTVCGGFGGGSCGPSEWCDFPRDAFCGAADGTGICEPQPEVCDEIFMPVCGCNDVTYSNACEAHAAGVDDAVDGECERPPPPPPPPPDGECMSDADCAPSEYCSACRGPGGLIYVCIPDGAAC